MNRNEAQRLLAEAKRRAEAKGKLRTEVVCKDHPRQAAFVDDPNDLVTCCTSRRSGKTYGIGIRLLRAAQKNPRSLVPYITGTGKQAKRNFWPVLHTLNDELELGLKFNVNELTAQLPNGSLIALSGADDEAEVDRWRGGKFPEVALDEAQSIREHLIERLLMDSLEPGVMDYDGTILVTGTPGPILSGFFYNIQKPGSGYSTHHWTVLDNPHIPHADTWIKKRMKRYGWTEDTPRFQREYRGKWVYDPDSLIFKYNPAVNLIHELPPGDDWRYVLGVDLGFRAATAFVVVAYSVERRELVCVYSDKKTELIPSAIAAEIDRLGKRWPLETIVVDTGNLGTMIVEEFNKQYGIPAVGPNKAPNYKDSAIELLNGDLRNGTIKFLKGHTAELVWELEHLQLDERRRRRKDAENHASDAFLYAYLQCMHWLHEDEEVPPEPYSPEWWRQEEDRMEAEEVRKWEDEQTLPWYLRL